MKSTVNRSLAKNNFAFARLLFAVFVIMSHSYPLVGLPEHDWLWAITNGQVFLSWFGVRGIFVISGFLIFRSLVRSKDISEFYWRRLLRLFPPLAGVLIVTVLLGPFVYEGSTPYLLNRSVLTYVANNLSLYNMQFGIDGIFESNTFNSTINGSLWTRPIEFTLYVAVSLLFFIRQKRKVLIFLLAVLYLALAALSVFFRNELQGFHYFFIDWFLIELGVYFVAGALLAVCSLERVHMRHINTSFWTTILLSILAVRFALFGYVMVIFIPLLTITFCLRSFPVISNLQEKIGDLSYGLHLYSFPVQQTLVYFFGLGYLSLMISSLLLSSVFAYFSYHLIEKQVVKFKGVNPLQRMTQWWKITNGSFVNRSAGVD